MTPETLAELERLCRNENITRGPWIAWYDPRFGSYAVGNPDDATSVCVMQANGERLTADNAKFIALAREAVPALLARVRELEGARTADPCGAQVKPDYVRLATRRKRT